MTANKNNEPTAEEDLKKFKRRVMAMAAAFDEGSISLTAEKMAREVGLSRSRT